MHQGHASQTSRSLGGAVNEAPASAMLGQSTPFGSVVLERPVPQVALAAEIVGEIY